MNKDVFIPVATPVSTQVVTGNGRSHCFLKAGKAQHFSPLAKNGDKTTFSTCGRLLLHKSTHLFAVPFMPVVNVAGKPYDVKNYPFTSTLFL